jgi:sterol desaturase/sphingolipid hydroxylase (fatty acid hydroxylase superfamily)
MGLYARVLENLGVWLPAFAATCVPPPTDAVLASIPKLAVYLAVVATIIVEGIIFAQHVLNSWVYKHVPRYSAGGRAPCSDVGYVLRDFCITMLPATAVSSLGFATLLLFTKSEADWSATRDLGHTTVRPGAFIIRWAMVRLIVDVVFFSLHRLMHSDQSRVSGGIYNTVHRTHHEHRSPHVWTNYHFSIADLILEGFVSYGVALATMQLLGWHTSALEEFGLLAHVMWYEVGSHAGKPVPTLSFCPWAAVIYRSHWFQSLTGAFCAWVARCHCNSRCVF